MRHRRPGALARHRARASKERSLTGPSFVGSFPRADAVLALPLPEIAFLGRSNVGKSSLLNAFVGQRIARISGTPGKTRALNVYEIPVVRGAWYVVAGGPNRPSGTHREQPRTTPRALYLLDLPGYGYARASKGELTAFRGLLSHVVKRARLVGVVWLLDIRRDLSPEDQAMQDAFAAAGTPVLAALTKSDKLPRGQRLARAAALRETLGVAADQLILTSARTGEGVPELREAVAGLIA
jgi:GTP-binding protein